MKTLLFILLLMPVTSFGAPKSEMENTAQVDKLKWTRLGYEVARAHAPDYEIAGHIVYEACGDDAEFWSPQKELGESWEYAPSGFNVIRYHEGSYQAPVYYRCKAKG
jgi:hypothetical protein